jgi:hypothetical protein
MKRAAWIPLVLLLTGCGPSFPTIDSSALSEAVAQVRGHTVKICSYFPSDDSLISILTASNAVLESAYNLAKQICDAVTASVPAVAPAQMGETRQGDQNQCPMVRGVCITGRFVDQPQQEAPAP